MQEQSMPPAEAPKEKTPPEEKGHLTRTHLYILLAILSVAILGLCGYIVWDLYQTEETASQSTYIPIETEEDGETSAEMTEETPDEEETTNEESESVISWTTYSNDDLGVILEYPDDWDVEEQLTDSLEDGTDDDLRLQISSGEYTFKLDIPAGTGPYSCIYEEPDSNEPQVTYFDNYVEIPGDDTIYRRSSSDYDGDLYFTICEKADSEVYVSWLYPGYISYITPHNPEDNMLEILDDMLLSYESTHD